MYSGLVARISVSAAVYAIDRPYDYSIPEALAEAMLPGVRVQVPFGRGNRLCEGIVLSVTEASRREELKAVAAVLDDAPVLTARQLQLALWMRERFFCTVYDAVHAMLPSGLWYRDGIRNVKDKTASFAVLNIPAEEAMLLAAQKKRRAPAQAAVLELLAVTGSASAKEIQYFTGTTAAPLKALERLGYVALEQVEVFRRPQYEEAEPAAPLVLNEEQTNVFRELCGMLDGRAAAALLFGITGSGKTAVYIRLIQQVLSAGKTAVVLVPEISLTPQLMHVFSSHFGEDVAVLHSSLRMGERYDEWKRIRAGQAHVVIGTRSAVFAPVENLGLLILDEEQESTYKSENAPRYHAREIAKYRCVQDGALLLLGSATPAVESMYHARQGTYRLLTLTGRYNRMALPDVRIADLREELRAGNSTTVSGLLREELQRNLDAREQSILFINRRGTSSFVVCGACGYTFSCVNCSVSMTYHAANRRLMCHYCGYSIPVPAACPECGGALKFSGAGTQKVEEDIRSLFPDVPVLRMDTDTVSPTMTHEMILSTFREEQVPILIGTQMVTKGLDFPGVTLVGVISADQSLYAGDYRAHERTFSLITQVVGRSGRGEKRGRAVIQTFTPGNEVLQLAARQDYPAFYEREIQLRAVTGSPPSAELLALTVTGPDEAAVLRGCMRLRDALNGYLRDLQGLRILGPSPASVTKVSNRYRYRLLLSCRIDKRVRDTVAHVLRAFAGDKENRGVSVFADTDPLD